MIVLRKLTNTSTVECRLRFPKLFGGGEAHLELTENDLLNTGVIIMARPPGKRVTNLQLLSGGEKALNGGCTDFCHI